MPEKTDYTTESKEEIRRLSKAGEVETWYRIWATSKKGSYFHVDVPEKQLGHADAYLTARARELDNI